MLDLRNDVIVWYGAYIMQVYTIAAGLVMYGLRIDQLLFLTELTLRNGDLENLKQSGQDINMQDQNQDRLERS